MNNTEETTGIQRQKKQRNFLLIGLAALAVIFLAAAAYFFFVLTPGRSESLEVSPLPLGEAPQAIRLTVLKTGIAAITEKQLSQTTLPIETISAETLQLTRDGEPVPYYISQDENGEAALYFYAQAVTNTLEAPAVYWLAPGEGQQMVQVDATVDGAEATTTGQRRNRWEENEIFLAQADGDDVWLGKLLFAPGSLDVPLDDIQPTGDSGLLTVQIWSNNRAQENPDHHVELLLNGEKLLDTYWEGIKQETITITLEAGMLLPTDNVLTINAPNDTGAAGEALYIDWVDLQYEGALESNQGELAFWSDADALQVTGFPEKSLVFDVTDPAAPMILTNTESEGKLLKFSGSGRNRHYMVADADQIIQPEISLVPLREPLTAEGRGADYIAIVADVEGFDEAITPLLDYREEQGMSVAAVPLSQVFDEFGYGRQSTEAIRDFLAYAVAAWQPTPRYVLLVGDASYDIYNFTDGPNKNIFPTHLVFTEFAGYVASDTWFTIFDDETLIPEIAIGRFPVQNVEQLKTLVNKTITYEESGGQDWINRALLVADDEPAFDTASEDLAGELNLVGYDTEKLYMSENEDIHDEIVSALNQGVGIVNYIGHGSIQVWGDESVLVADDANILINGQRLPIFTTFTCLNGYFNHPEANAMAETLLWAEDGGVAASVAPSGRSLTSQQEPLAEVFFQSLFNGDAQTLGEALLLAKTAEASNVRQHDVIHTFNLLGDPALQFQLP
ncbi:MAG: C25 family cysteine peptidase [Candidatus Promineifilaceae bacterium]